MDPKMMMFIASVVGASVGVFYISGVGPLNNYGQFLALFALAGAGAANIVLMIVVRVFDWLKAEPAKKAENSMEEKPEVVVQKTDDVSQ